MVEPFIKEYALHLDILLSAIGEKHGSLEEYVFFSPFVYSVIFGNKRYSPLLEEIFFRKVHIKLSPASFDEYVRKEVDISFFLEIHKRFPAFEKDFHFWINKMFFSIPHIRFYMKTGAFFDFFKPFIKQIHINFLSPTDIVLPLDFLFFLAQQDFRKKGDVSSLDYVKGNNIFLMLVSDYKDIFLGIREKTYYYDKEHIEECLRTLEELTSLGRNELFSLDFQVLMQKNFFLYKEVTTDFLS